MMGFSRTNIKLGIIAVCIAAFLVDYGASQRFTSEQTDMLARIKVTAKEAGLDKSEWRNIDKFDKDVCYDKECLDSALEIFSATNFKEDPCEDNKWLDFVCKRRLKGIDKDNQLTKLIRAVNLQTLSILENKGNKHSKDFMFLQAKTYYDQCIDKASHDVKDVEFILKNTEKDGGWPIFTHEVPSSDSFDWLNMVADQNRYEKFGFEPLFFKVDVNRSHEAILMDLSLLSFPLTKQSLDDYETMVKAMQKEAVSSRYSDNPVNTTQIHSAMSYMLNFNYKVREVMPKMDASVKIMTIKELQETSDANMKKFGLRRIDWSAFFNRVLAGSDIRLGETLNHIIIPFVPIMEIVVFIEQQLAKDDNKVHIANALHMNMVPMLLHESTSLVDDLTTFRCNAESGTRESICLARVKEVFGYSLGKTYLKEYYDDDHVTPEVSKLMENINKGYITRLEETEWMTQETKEFLYDKVRSIRVQIGQPNWMRKKGELEKFYKGLNSSRRANSLYPRNFMEVNMWMVAKKRAWSQKLARITSLSQFDSYDATWNHYLGNVNAFYQRITNQIQIEAGIVQDPIFGVKRPGFMNYGGLGMVLAHEIGHSFDTNGRRYDKNGDDSKEHWDAESVKQYEEWVEKVKQLYASVPYNISDKLVKSLDPNVTINEDIADALGIFISFDSYKTYLRDLEKTGRSEKVLPGLKAFSPQKLFFMKYANMWCEKADVQSRFDQMFDAHSPSNRRATVPLMRSEEFANTFQCKKKTKRQAWVHK